MGVCGCADAAFTPRRFTEPPGADSRADQAAGPSMRKSSMPSVLRKRQGTSRATSPPPKVATPSGHRSSSPSASCASSSSSSAASSSAVEGSSDPALRVADAEGLATVDEEGDGHAAFEDKDDVAFDDMDVAAPLEYATPSDAEPGRTDKRKEREEEKNRASSA